MNKYFGSTEGMTVDQLRQVYGDNNVNAVIKKVERLIMFIIGLVLGLAGGYFLHANQDAVIKFVDEKVGKWFKRS